MSILVLAPEELERMLYIHPKPRPQAMSTLLAALSDAVRVIADASEGHPDTEDMSTSWLAEWDHQLRVKI